MRSFQEMLASRSQGDFALEREGFASEHGSLLSSARLGITSNLLT